MFGKKRPPETIKKLSENSSLKKPILQLDPKTGLVVGKWNSITDAATRLSNSRNINKKSAISAISMICRKYIPNAKTAFGFKWEYVKTKTEPQINVAPN